MEPLVHANRTNNLLGLLSNPIIFDHIIPLLPLQVILHLARTSHLFRKFVYETPKVFRYLDLSKCRGAYIPPLAPIDNGGHTWRAERIDENLTEDEFYAGPLRGVLSKLERTHVLQDVQVLVLDELASVTNDLVVEICTRKDLIIKMLSMRKCKNINPSKLQQFLKYLCRPERPEGSPTLRGLYFFTEPSSSKERQENADMPTGMLTSDGATLGVLPLDKSRNTKNSDPWYVPTGRVVEHGYSQRSAWEETLTFCRGIIAFDAVLCIHMHDAMSGCLHEGSSDFLSKSKPGIAPIATMALGPEGCSSCGDAPNGAPVWGESDPMEFPLLWPPPYSGRINDAVRPPTSRETGGSPSRPSQRLIVSCTWCLTNRHCDSCHRWWCANCYNPKKTKKLSDLEALSNAGLSDYLPSRDELAPEGLSGSGDSIKVFNHLCVENCLVGEMMSGAGSFGMWA